MSQTLFAFVFYFNLRHFFLDCVYCILMCIAGPMVKNVNMGKGIFFLFCFCYIGVYKVIQCTEALARLRDRRLSVRNTLLSFPNDSFNQDLTFDSFFTSVDSEIKLNSCWRFQINLDDMTSHLVTFISIKINITTTNTHFYGCN